MYKAGEAIQCWTKEEAIRKYYELASKGILAEHDPKRENRLIIIKGDKEEEEQ